MRVCVVYKSILRTEWIKERRICYKVCISKVEESLKTNLKSFWSLVCEFKQEK